VLEAVALPVVVVAKGAIQSVLSGIYMDPKERVPVALERWIETVKPLVLLVKTERVFDVVETVPGLTVGNEYDDESVVNVSDEAAEAEAQIFVV
jgi:hypothetical protein